MRTAPAAQMRALTNEELDLVSGGKTYVSRIGGFTFTLKDGELTVSAGDVSVTTGKGYVLTSQPM